MSAPIAPKDADNPTIPDEESLFRRLSDAGPDMVAVDAATGARRPSSGAFKPDPDVSVYRHSVLSAHGLDAHDLIKVPQNLVVSLSVADVRHRAQLGVRDDAWPPDVEDPTHPRNAAHALIVGWTGLSRSQVRERQRALARAPSLVFLIG